MKRKRLGYVIIGLLLLSGCHTSSKNSTDIIQKSRSDSSTLINMSSEKIESTIDSQKITITSSSSSDIPTKLWNDDKAMKLQQFMKNWGNTMGQYYTEYLPEHSINYWGVSVPDQLLSGEVAINLDGQAVPFDWSTDGEYQDQYNIVSVYADDQKHCYLFTIFNGEAKVLVGQQNAYYEIHSLPFKETENQELKTGFSEIVNTSNNSLKQSNNVRVIAINYDEAKELVEAATMSFSDELGHLVKDGEFEFTKGGNHIPTEDGGMILRQYSGARGFEEYTVTPINDNQVRVIWVTSSIDNSRRVNIETVKDIIIQRK